MKKEKNASKEALNAASFPEFFFRPGGRQVGAVLLTFGIPGNDCNSTKHSMNPGNQPQASVGRIQTDDTGTDLIEAHCPCQQELCKRSIMGIGRREQKEDRQARTTTDEGMNPEAA
jgi:hypothetical protein